MTELKDAWEELQSLIAQLTACKYEIKIISLQDRESIKGEFFLLAEDFNKEDYEYVAEQFYSRSPSNTVIDPFIDVPKYSFVHKTNSSIFDKLDDRESKIFDILGIDDVSSEDWKRWGEPMSTTGRPDYLLFDRQRHELKFSEVKRWSGGLRRNQIDWFEKFDHLEHEVIFIKLVGEKEPSTEAQLADFL